MGKLSGCALRLAALMIAGSLLVACSGDDGAPGAAGPPGPPGPPPPPPPPPVVGIPIGDGTGLTPEEIATLGKLEATITSVTVNSAPVVEFTVTDASGNPAIGIDSSVIDFTFAKLVPGGDPAVNGGLAYWQSYLNAVETDNPATGDHVLAQAVEARSDACTDADFVELGGGQYQCTFTTDVTNVTSPIAVPWDAAAMALTHRVGMEIRLGGPGEIPLAPDNPVLDFVPDGSAGNGVTKAIADTLNCNGCHYELDLHGGPRKSVEYCVTCHNPGSVDQDTGESIDMAYLAHSIHMGADRAVPYVVWGFTEIFSDPAGFPFFGPNSGKFDASEIHYPQAQTYCETCHTDSGTHPDGDNWNEQASAKACGGCHADGLVAQNFDAVTGQAEYLFDHAVSDVAQVGMQEDGACMGCHLGAIPTAGPALAIHSNVRGNARTRAEAGDNFVFEILGATNTGPGETPVVTIRISDPQGNPYDILTAPEFDTANSGALNLYVQVATADYYGGDENGLVLGARQNDDLSIVSIQALNFRDAGYPYRMRIDAIRDAIVNGGGSVNPDGSYDVPFFQALPDPFTGSVAIGLAGHPGWEFEDADGVTAFDRASTVSAVYYPGAPRAAAFDSVNCDACHKRLQFHGGNRNGNYEVCLLCHNSDAAVCSSNPYSATNPPVPDDPARYGECPDGETQEGYHFGLMIHSIHNASTTYEGGAFAEVKYPQTTANCDTCHKPSAYNTARLTARAVSTNQGSDIRVWTDDIATTPTAAACGVCHTSSPAIGHFESQGGQVDDLKCTIVGAGCSAADGSGGTGLPNGQEACTVCHGTGAEFETSKYHNPGLPAE